MDGGGQHEYKWDGGCAHAPLADTRRCDHRPDLSDPPQPALSENRPLAGAALCPPGTARPRRRHRGKHAARLRGRPGRGLRHGAGHTVFKGRAGGGVPRRRPQPAVRRRARRGPADPSGIAGSAPGGTRGHPHSHAPAGAGRRGREDAAFDRTQKRTKEPSALRGAGGAAQGLPGRIHRGILQPPDRRLVPLQRAGGGTRTAGGVHARLPARRQRRRRVLHGGAAAQLSGAARLRGLRRQRPALLLPPLPAVHVSNAHGGLDRARPRPRPAGEEAQRNMHF